MLLSLLLLIIIWVKIMMIAKIMIKGVIIVIVKGKMYIYKLRNRYR